MSGGEKSEGSTAATEGAAATDATAGVSPTKASESEVWCRNKAPCDADQKPMVALLEDWLRLRSSRSARTYIRENERCQSKRRGQQDTS